MGGYTNKRPSGYLECDYNNPFPGLVTNLPTSQIPPGAVSSCSAMVVRGRLTAQPAIFAVTGTAALTVTMPFFAAGENVCAQANLQQPGLQFGATVLITNLAVYMDFVLPFSIGAQKVFSKIYTFPIAYPRYARFGYCVIGNILYFSSASLLGLYALRPTFAVASVAVLNPGGYFMSPPTVVFSDGGGTGATGVATAVGGNLTAIAVTTGGTYIAPPIVNLNGGAAFPLPFTYQFAVAGAILSTVPNGYVVQEVSAYTGVAHFNTGTPGGTGYSNPTLAFIGGGGTGAAGQAILSTDGLGSIVGVTMTSFGQNYTSLPTVEIIDPSGIGAVNPTLIALFNGLPFIGADFLAAMSNRLLLGNIIGGDGNNTTTLTYAQLATEGAGYTGYPGVDVIGGGGVNGSYYVLTGGGATAGEVITAHLGQLTQFTGILTSGSPNITGVSSLVGIQAGMNLTDFQYGIPALTTVLSTTPNANLNLTGTFTNGGTSITGVSSTAGVLPGQPINGFLIPAQTFVVSASGSTIVISQGALGNQTSSPFQVVIGNTVTMSADATESTTESIAAYGYIEGNQGSGYYGQPAAAITGNNTLEATLYPYVSGIVQRNSTSTHYPDRIAWSAPNAYGYFDPNWLTAPGGYNTLAEAKGLVTSVNVVESVAFVGHNGGITEMTPNAGGGNPFAFYPLWSSDEGVVVRYGSMAQYGTTLCFLANDSAYSMTPGGLTEIGGNIANLLQNCSTWNNGNFPLQGLYGSIVLIEGQKHYLIALSADDWDLANNPRSTTVFDFNMNENSWHQWSYSGTLTAPIFCSFDTAEYTSNATANNTQISRDSWLLAAFTSTISGSPNTEAATVYELAPLNREIQLLSLSVTAVIGTQVFAYQFRTEAPSIARLNQERRILIEYENYVQLYTLAINPVLTLTYTGQQDPTAQTGTVSQQQVSSQVLNQITASTIAGQVLTAQADFGTFTGVCTSLKLSGFGTASLASLVRITQVSDLPKTQVP